MTLLQLRRYRASSQEIFQHNCNSTIANKKNIHIGSAKRNLHEMAFYKRSQGLNTSSARYILISRNYLRKIYTKIRRFVILYDTTTIIYIFCVNCIRLQVQLKYHNQSGVLQPIAAKQIPVPNPIKPQLIYLTAIPKPLSSLTQSDPLLDYINQSTTS